MVFLNYSRVWLGVLKKKRRRMKMVKGESVVVRVYEKTLEILPSPTEGGV
jgi:hypothetical protein